MGVDQSSKSSSNCIHRIDLSSSIHHGVVLTEQSRFSGDELTSSPLRFDEIDEQDDEDVSDANQQHDLLYDDDEFEVVSDSNNDTRSSIPDVSYLFF